MQDSTLLVYSSVRSMREGFKANTILPKTMIMGDFFNELIFIESYRALPKSLRLPLFMQAMKKCKEDIIRAKFAFESSFLAFLESSSFALSFFSELASANIHISEIPKEDTYGDYEDHLRVLCEIEKAYKDLLEQGRYYDGLILPQGAKISLNTRFIQSFSAIEIFLNGIILPLHQQLLSQASKITPISVRFELDKYNQSLAFLPVEILSQCRDFGHFRALLHQSEIAESTPLPPLAQINAYAFSLRINQAALVFAKIDEWIKAGVSESDIAVILPNEDFRHYLAVLDEKHNLNYAMGKDISQSKVYQALEKFIDSENALEIKDFNAMKECVESITESFNDNDSLRVKARMNEILFEWRAIAEYDFNELLRLLLNELKGYTIDDTAGGKITVIGTLESRGLAFKKVIIVDFNEGSIPHLQDNDLFLNSILRKRLNLPTTQDKEQLQKHYYYHIFTHSDEVAIAYVENDESSPSLMLEELGLAESCYKNGDDIFMLLPQARVEREYVEDRFYGKLPKNLSPSKLEKLLKCPREYYLRYIENLQESSEPISANVGNLVHLCLKSVYEAALKRGRLQSDELYNDALKFLNNEISHSQDYALIAEIEWLKLELKSFFHKDISESDIEILALECEGEIECGGFRFHLRPDRIQRNGNALEVIDYKYKKAFKLETKDFSDFALVLYGALAQKLYPQYADLELRLIYWDIRGEGKRSENVAKNISELEKILQNLSGEISFEKTQNVQNCQYCEFVELCNRA